MLQFKQLLLQVLVEELQQGGAEAEEVAVAMEFQIVMSNGYAGHGVHVQVIFKQGIVLI